MYKESLAAGYGTPAALNQAADVPRQTQLISAAERHSKLLSMVHERVAVLERRLGPVLRPSGPTEAKKSINSTNGPMAPLASSLHQISDELEQVETMLGDMLDRLEL